MRSAALDAAEAILMEAGPAALTLKAVAARIGRTHASLLHHFGSASGLHHALGQHMADRHRARMMRAIDALGERRITVRQMVDELFDSNNEQGGIQLMTWLLLTGNEPMFDPIMQALKDQIDAFSHARASTAPAQGVVDLAIMTHLLAMGDALMGEAMTRVLGLPRDRPREIATRAIQKWLQDNAAQAPERKEAEG
jgi:AcrR family transcriptional regulator